jgi:hypothetical protein
MGALTRLRIRAENAIGIGEASEEIQLTSAALPSASQRVWILEEAGYGPNFLDLVWLKPADTGKFDQTLQVTYEL